MLSTDEFYKKMDINKLIKSRLYSEELGINLKEKSDKELFKWLLASILFGARISESTAKKTYKTFEKYNILAPEKILRAGWEFLVNPIMREGGYVRYDEKTSTQILRNCGTFIKKYNGSFDGLLNKAQNNQDIENKLMEFYGIGPITANIFLRELRPFWKKVNPEPLLAVKKLAEKYNININSYDRKKITFIRLESGLIRLMHQKK
ncbi:hypothetical protein ACFL4O_02445 [bacterium]